MISWPPPSTPLPTPPSPARDPDGAPSPPPPACAPTPRLGKKTPRRASTVELPRLGLLLAVSEVPQSIEDAPTKALPCGIPKRCSLEGRREVRREPSVYGRPLLQQGERQHQQELAAQSGITLNHQVQMIWHHVQDGSPAVPDQLQF